MYNIYLYLCLKFFLYDFFIYMKFKLTWRIPISTYKSKSVTLKLMSWSILSIIILYMTFLAKIKT